MPCNCFTHRWFGTTFAAECVVRHPVRSFSGDRISGPPVHALQHSVAQLPHIVICHAFFDRCKCPPLLCLRASLVELGAPILIKEHVPACILIVVQGCDVGACEHSVILELAGLWSKVYQNCMKRFQPERLFLWGQEGYVPQQVGCHQDGFKLPECLCARLK